MNENVISPTTAAIRKQQIQSRLKLHASTKAKHQVQGRLLLDIVITQCAAVLQLLARKDEALLVRWNSLFVLNLGLDVLNTVTGLDLQRDLQQGKRTQLGMMSINYFERGGGTRGREKEKREEEGGGREKEKERKKDNKDNKL